MSQEAHFRRLGMVIEQILCVWHHIIHNVSLHKWINSTATNKWQQGKKTVTLLCHFTRGLLWAFYILLAWFGSPCPFRGKHQCKSIQLLLTDLTGVLYPAMNHFCLDGSGLFQDEPLITSSNGVMSDEYESDLIHMLWPSLSSHLHSIERGWEILGWCVSTLCLHQNISWWNTFYKSSVYPSSTD